MLESFNQLVLEVTDRDAFITMTRKFTNVYTNAFMSLIEDPNSEQYIVLRNRLLKFNRSFVPSE